MFMLDEVMRRGGQDGGCLVAARLEIACQERGAPLVPRPPNLAIKTLPCLANLVRTFTLKMSMCQSRRNPRVLPSLERPTHDPK